MKYFYLLFSRNDILPLTDVVFNTEAHPFPRFELGKLFKTGWQRKPRDGKGNLLPDEPANVDAGVEADVKTVTQTLEKEAGTTTTDEVQIGEEATPPPNADAPVLDPVSGKAKEMEA